MGAAILRIAFLLSGIAFLGWTIGFTARLPAVTSLWPWPDGRLSYIFIGSIAGAFAVGALWTWWSGSYRAAIASLCGFIVISVLLVLTFAWTATSEPPFPSWPHAAAFAVMGLASAAVLALCSREPPETGTLMPLVRWSCVVFALTLFCAGIALVLRYPLVFPWPLSPQSSVAFGCLFIGLSVVYALTALWSSPGSGVIAMLGFLVYDIVLLPPFLMHFGMVAPERMPSLVIYTAVLVYSALLALYLLVSERRLVLRPA